MIKIVQERPVLVELEAVVNHCVHARLVFEGTPVRVSFLDQ
jgi:hypothetical protein